MKCTASLEELSAYVDGELDGVRAAAVEDHLRACEPCRTQAASLRSVSGLLGEVTHAVDPSARLRAGFARRLAMTEDLPRFTCSRMQVAMSEMLDGELAGEEAHLVKEHLHLCPACSGEYATLDQMALSVRALPEVEPPLGLERAIRAAIAREQQGLFRWPSLGQILQPRLAPGLATAMAGATLALGFWLGRAVPTAPVPGLASAPVHQGEAIAARPAPRVAAVQPPVASRSVRTGRFTTYARRRRLAPTEVAVRPAAAPASVTAARAARVKASVAARGPATKPAGSTVVATATTTPVIHPITETPTPAELAPVPAASTPAPAAPPAEAAVVARAPKPAQFTVESIGEVQPTAPQSTRLVERWKRKYRVEQELGALSSHPPTKNVGATIATLRF